MACSRSTLAFLLASLASSGCGGSDGGEGTAALPEPVAREVYVAGAAIEAALQAGRACSAAKRASELRMRTVGAVNAGDVPARLQEELLGAANELAESIQCPRGRRAEIGRARELVARLLELAGHGSNAH